MRVIIMTLLFPVLRKEAETEGESEELEGVSCLRNFFFGFCFTNHIMSMTIHKITLSIPIIYTNNIRNTLTYCTHFTRSI